MSSPAEFSRRALLLGSLAALAGCGFSPVYAPGAFGGDGAASSGFALITVTRIPERSGQLLRQALQARLDVTGDDVPKRYDLDIMLTIAQDGMAILPDNSTSRQRYSAAAAYTLRAHDEKSTVMVTGSARLNDAANVINNQYFASDLETETITKRLTAGLADQIALQLAAWFKLHPDAAKPLPPAPPA